VDTFIQCFVREGNGAWRCTRPAELQVEVGRIQVAPGTTFTKGTMFMGIDLAALLEDYHQTTGASEQRSGALAYAASSQCS
jgi:hypothetical protein